MKFTLFPLFIILVALPHYALAESAEAFIVEVKDAYTKVLGPRNYQKNQNVIIKNQTLMSLRGRLESSEKGVLEHISIPSKENKSVSVEIGKGEKLYFLPLSPSLQAVELEFGRNSYEIPPQE